VALQKVLYFQWVPGAVEIENAIPIEPQFLTSLSEYVRRTFRRSTYLNEINI